jgi:hypothetical protein
MVLDTAGGKRLLAIVVVLDRQRPLAELISTSCLICGFACGLNCRQQQRDQDANDGNDNQQFDQRKSAALHRIPQSSFPVSPTISNNPSPAFCKERTLNKHTRANKSTIIDGSI